MSRLAIVDFNSIAEFSVLHFHNVAHMAQLQIRRELRPCLKLKASLQGSYLVLGLLGPCAGKCSLHIAQLWPRHSLGLQLHHALMLLICTPVRQ